MRHEIIEFLKTQWDKILLCYVIVHFSTMMIYFLWRFPNLDAATLQWLEKSIDLAEGALIGAVTTAAAMRRDPPPGSVTVAQKTETTVTPPKE